MSRRLPHDTRTWMPIYAIGIETTTTCLLGIRLWSRFRRTGGRLGVDDFFITMGWATATANIGVVLLFSFRYGLDRHAWDVPRPFLEKSALLGWVISLLFLWGTAFTKISVLLFYRRLVAGTCSRRFQWALWIAIAFVVLYTIVFITLLLTECTPLVAVWRAYDPLYPKTYRCLSIKLQTYTSELSGSLSVLTDIYSVMLPMSLLMKLRTTRRQRIGLMFVFGLGFLIVIAGIVRTYFLGIAKSNFFDKTRFSFNVIVASIAEEHIAIICACAPSLKSCFRSYFCEQCGSKASKIKSGEVASPTSPHRRPGGRGSWMVGPVLVERSFDVKHEVVKSSVSITNVNRVPEDTVRSWLSRMEEKDIEVEAASQTSWFSAIEEDELNEAKVQRPKQVKL